MHVTALLELIREDFPRRKRELEKIREEFGDLGTVEQIIEPPELVEAIPTFDPAVSRSLTPMLRERFAFAGAWTEGGRRWLSASQMREWTSKPDIRHHHAILREHHNGSAPMRFRDDQLGLFGVDLEELGNFDYLVWGTDDGEPQVWHYRVGAPATKFRHLVNYLKWYLQFD